MPLGVVKDEIPQSQRATFFARLEALFQSCWVVGALVPTLAAIPLLPGLIAVAAVALLTGAVGVLGLAGMGRRRRSRLPDGPEPHGRPLRHDQIS
jgi:hypothetical protein